MQNSDINDSDESEDIKIINLRASLVENHRHVELLMLSKTITCEV